MNNINKKQKDKYEKKYFPPKVTDKQIEDINNMTHLGLNNNNIKKNKGDEKIFIKKNKNKNNKK